MTLPRHDYLRNLGVTCVRAEFEKTHYPDVYSRERLASTLRLPEPRLQVYVMYYIE